jgi:hypothetical protein
MAATEQYGPRISFASGYEAISPSIARVVHRLMYRAKRKAAAIKNGIPFDYHIVCVVNSKVEYVKGDCPNSLDSVVSSYAIGSSPVKGICAKAPVRHGRRYAADIECGTNIHAYVVNVPIDELYVTPEATSLTSIKILHSEVATEIIKLHTVKSDRTNRHSSNKPHLCAALDTAPIHAQIFDRNIFRAVHADNIRAAVWV